MTLMHSIIASRYLTPASLLEPACWPAGTIVQEADVLVNGESLAEQGRCATPAVRIGPVAEPTATHVVGGRRFVTVVITRVVAVSRGVRRGVAEVHVDADLGQFAAHVNHTRVLGRRPSRRSMKAQLRMADGNARFPLRLPHDLQTGDLLAIPCEGAITPAQIRMPCAIDDNVVPRCSRHTGA